MLHIGQDRFTKVQACQVKQHGAMKSARVQTGKHYTPVETLQDSVIKDALLRLCLLSREHMLESRMDEKARPSDWV